MAVARSSGRLYPASLGTAAFFMLLASIFFWLAAFSTPYIKHIYWVETREDQQRFGTFGWCNSLYGQCYKHDGYAWHPLLPGGTHLTGSLVLIPLTAFFSSLGFFALLHSIRDLRSGLCSFLLTALSALLSTLSLILALSAFVTLHRRAAHLALAPKYGPALPLLIVGWLLYLAAAPLVLVGWWRERHYRASAGGRASASVSGEGVVDGPRVGAGLGLGSGEKARRWGRGRCGA